MSIIQTTAATAVRRPATWLTLATVALLASPAAVRGQAFSASPSPNAWVAPARAAHRPNPLLATTAVINRGRDIFLRDCAQCHGKAGHGDGPQAGSLEIRPADLPSERVQSQPDGALFWKISEGRGVMPRATLSDNDKWTVINYIRTLAPRP